MPTDPNARAFSPPGQDPYAPAKGSSPGFSCRCPTPDANPMLEPGGGMNYPLLTIYADLLDDLERSRIATENRIRSLREIKGMAGSSRGGTPRLDSDGAG